MYKQKTYLMGSDFEITVVAKTQLEADKQIAIAIGEISRIEALISSWKPTSETSNINKNAGASPVQVSEELFSLIQRALQISNLTDGAFDISYASMDKLWKYDGSMAQMPSKEAIKKSVAKVGYQDIIVDPKNSTVFLKNKGMKIGFGAIGKGYAADKAKKLLISNGVSGGIINASGDINSWGSKPSGSSWQVAITNPLNKNKAFAMLPIKDAVVTSGNYEKYVTFNSRRYSHIIDPRTGYPSQGIISVTVFAPKAELADALATSVFVMGVETGIDRINQLKAVECIIITDTGSIITSNNLTLNTQE
ncbi:MAG: FAD:protein FMN transferase [Ulvibacter sp.]|nr:FAD:protein FMN transferase [Ulvibacter sp.]